MTNEWILVVPRKQESAFDQISLNAMAFYGSFLLKS